jgi:hypothetical protein
MMTFGEKVAAKPSVTIKFFAGGVAHDGIALRGVVGQRKNPFSRLINPDGVRHKNGIIYKKRIRNPFGVSACLRMAVLSAGYPGGHSEQKNQKDGKGVPFHII